MKLEPEDIPKAVAIMQKRGTISDTTRRRFLAVATSGMAMGLAGCAGLIDDEEPTDDDTDDRADDDEPAEPEPVELTFRIPRAVESDGTPIDDGQIDFHSYASVLHGLYMAGAIARGSEFGHENYRSELAGDYMRERGEIWVEMIDDITDTFWDDGEIAQWLEETDDGWKRSEDVSLIDYAHGVYAYHMHHRGPRWEGEGHEDLATEIIFSSAPFISRYGEYIFDNFYEKGRFYRDTDHTEFDTESMSYGLSGTHGTAYAWVRWGSPDGEEDMGNVAEQTLEAFLGYRPEDLVEIYRDVAEELLDAWDDEVGAYDFGDGTHYSLHTLGPLLHGNKAAYETLAIFGEDDDFEIAEGLAENTATMLDPIVRGDVTQPWGIPHHIEYTPNGLEPASDEVDVGLHWEFIKHITGGWSLTREREGENSPQLLASVAPDLMDNAIGSFTDEQLLGAIDYHLDDSNIAITAVDYETGEVTDDRYTADGLGMFLTGIGNIYRDHEAVVRARDWGDVEDEELLEQSEHFHDLYVENAEFLKDYFVVRT